MDKNSVQVFSDRLVAAYREYASQLQGRDPGRDLQQFRRYLCGICDLIADSTDAESVSILMRQARRPEFPKGSLLLVAWNKHSNWMKVPAGKQVIADLSHPGVTKEIYQGRSIHMDDYRGFADRRARAYATLGQKFASNEMPLGAYDEYVWSGKTLEDCFRLYLGIPIRIQPYAEPVGILRVENKRFEAGKRSEWDATGVTFRVGSGNIRYGVKANRQAHYKRIQRLERIRHELPVWKDNDETLIALAASYIAKVEELRLTMLAAQGDPPIPLDSRDFTYLRVSNDDFAKSASDYLHAAEENQRFLEFNLKRLLDDASRQQDEERRKETGPAKRRKIDARRRELAAVRLTSRVKEPRSLFERLKQQTSAFREARRIVMTLETGLALDDEKNRKKLVETILNGNRQHRSSAGNEFRTTAEDRIKGLGINIRRTRMILRKAREPWRDADYTTAPLRLSMPNENGAARSRRIDKAIRLLLQAMRRTSLKNAPTMGTDYGFVKWLLMNLKETDFIDLPRQNLLNQEEFIARLLLRHYDRHARRQLSYLLQLVRLAKGRNWPERYSEGYRLVKNIADELLRQKESRFSHDFARNLFRLSTREALDVLGMSEKEQARNVHRLGRNFAATYKRSRHLRTIEEVQRTVPELMHDIGRHDALGCRVICWFDSTCKLIARYILDRDARLSATESPWIVQRLKPIKSELNDGYSAIHIDLLLPPFHSGGHEGQFAIFAGLLNSCHRDLLGVYWDTSAGEFNHTTEIEFFLHLIDGEEGRKSSGKLPMNESWYDYYMSCTSAEVQIRTALMDTWASQYHAPVYKGYEDVSGKTRSQLIRLGARLSDIGVSLEKLYAGEKSAVKRSSKGRAQTPPGRHPSRARSRR